MKKLNMNVTIVAALGFLLTLVLNGCQSTSPPPAITCAFNPTGGIECPARITFQATGVANSTLTIVGTAAVTTGPNSDCATITVFPDSDTRSNVIDCAVQVNCDCSSGQTVNVVITVKDEAGNICDATCALTTP